MNNLAKKIDDFAKEIKFNGSILVSSHDEIILAEGYGYACFEHGINNKAGTIHRIASITKTFTAACILKLVEDKKLSLKDKISKFIPDFNKGDEISVHHVLSNSAGINNFDLEMDFYEIVNSDNVLSSLIDLVKDKPLLFEPGKMFNYSIAGFLVLQYIIEKVSGISYEEYLKVNFFDKLDIKNTGLEHPNRLVKNKSFNYKIIDEEVALADYIDMRIAGGGGGLFSTVYDIHRFNNSLLNSEILSKESTDKMFTGQIKADEYNSYGYGMIIAKGILDGVQIDKYYHSGGGNGVRSMNTIYHQENMQAIIITNIEDKNNFNKMYTFIEDLIKE